MPAAQSSICISLHIFYANFLSAFVIVIANIIVTYLKFNLDVTRIINGHLLLISYLSKIKI